MPILDMMHKQLLRRRMGKAMNSKVGRLIDEYNRSEMSDQLIDA